MKHTTTILLATLGAATLLAGAATLLYKHQQLPLTEPVRIYIPAGSTYTAMADTLQAHGCLVNRPVFDAAACLRGLTRNVRAGSYLMQPRMGLATVIQKLYSGNQDPIKLIINKQRTTADLCRYLSTKLDISADTLLHLLTDSATLAPYGCSPQTVFMLFPQNTYEVYWNIKPRKLLDRMKHEADRYWNPTRLQQCNALGLSPVQVMTLASIVEEETNATTEKAVVASVYLNRLRLGMPLQADPTVRYAVGNFGLRRITAAHLAVESPYNTYRHQGLPPGPICIPQPSSIEAVLANLKTDYLYFCAKEDFSGQHNFASTLAQHNANAARYHKALNQRNIK